ncbi:MAG TPA: hypothetical protein VEH48_01140 [Candidatus Nitrosopolaris sp.]|nr:hypothetical protein [Candidatus Nitrosopolaris sp.]
MMYTAIGIIGAVLVLFGFYRTSIGKWTGKSRLYELDNLVGASLITIYQWHYRVYVTVVVNIIWAIVALHGLTSYKQRRKAKK